MNQRGHSDRFYYLRLLQHYAWLILSTCLLGLGLAIWMIFFVLTPVYQAQSSLLVLEAQQGGLSTLVSRLESQLDVIGPLRNLGLPGSSGSSIDDLISILKSRSLAENVAQKTDLKSLPEVQRLLADAPDSYQDRILVQYLQAQTEVLPPDSRNHTLRIQTELSDSELSAELANQYVAALKAYVSTLIDKEQNRQLDYLNQQVKVLENELKTSEEGLLSFQKLHRTVSLDNEVEQLIKTLAGLEAQELTAQAALQEAHARRNSYDEHAIELAPESASTRNSLELEVAGLNERKAALKQAKVKYQRSLLGLPAQALSLARLQRQVSLKSQLYLLLQQQVQAARLDARREIELFRVLDPALPPLEPIKPVKGLWLAISGILSIGLGISMAMGHNFLSQMKKEPELHEISVD